MKVTQKSGNMHPPLPRMVHTFKSHPANRLEGSLRRRRTIAPSTTLHNSIRMTRRRLFADCLVPVHTGKDRQHHRH